MSQPTSQTAPGAPAYTRRRTLLINPRFQIRIATYVVSWVLALSFVYPLIVYNLFDYFMRYAQMDPMGPSVKSLLETRQDVVTLMVAVQVIFLLVNVIMSLFIAHRIAGPVYRLRTLLKKVTEGDYSNRMTLRKYDHFQELSDDYNDMVAALRRRNEECASRLQAAMGRIQDADVRSEVEAALKALHRA